MEDVTFTGLPTKFFDTGRQVDLDEDANGGVDQTYSLWATIAPPGTYTLGASGADGNMYIAIADNKLLVPEPASIWLVVLGALGLIGTRRRK